MALPQKAATYLAIAAIVTGGATPAAIAAFDFGQTIFKELQDTAGTVSPQGGDSGASTQPTIPK